MDAFGDGEDGMMAAFVMVVVEMSDLAVLMRTIL